MSKHDTSTHKHGWPLESFRSRDPSAAPEPHTISVSRETERRIRVIESRFGSDWRSRFPTTSISAVYRRAIRDSRLPVYALVTPEAKDMLWAIADDWNAHLSDVIEELIRNQCVDDPAQSISSADARFNSTSANS